MATNVLQLNDRIRRSRGRGSRTQTANAKVTNDEYEELQGAAKTAGKSLSEWSRDVLLNEARAKHTERATFTEIIAIKLLLMNALAPRKTPQSPAEFEQTLEKIRFAKHGSATDLLRQYTNPLGEQA